MIATLRSQLDRLRSGYLERPFTSVQLLLLSGGMLLVFGILMSISTTISASMQSDSSATPFAQLSNEILFVAVGVPTFWLGLRLPPRVYRGLVYPVLALAVLLMLAVFVPHIGVGLRWLRYGPIEIQPSEFAKLAMLLWGADVLARRQELRSVHRARHILWPLLPGFVAMCALVVLQKDLGTTLCFVTILLGLLWTVGLPFRYFIGVLGVVVIAVTMLAVFEPYRLRRLTSFTDPFKDANGNGHQAVQGFYALASGGIFGVGLGNGPAKYWVPNANTDYVFAVIGDELGLLGCLTVVLTFGLFAFTALRIARRTEDHFIRLASSGAAVWICGQALINIGYVTGLLPVTGIPLPFVSAGGTSLVLTMGVFGMLVSFARHEPQAVAAAREDAEIGMTSRIVRLLAIGTAQSAVTPVRQLSARHLRRVARRQARRDDRAVRKIELRESRELLRRERIEAARVEAIRLRAQKQAAAELRARRMAAAQAQAEREAVHEMQVRRRQAAERAAQPRTAQARTAQPRTAQPRTAQPRTAQPRTAQPRTAQPRTAQARTAQPRTAQPRTAQGRPAQPRSGQPRVAQPRSAQPRTAQPRSAQPEPRPKPQPTAARPNRPAAARRPQPHPSLRPTGTDVRR